MAGRLRCGPHISSFRLGGAASIGASASTVPSEGVSQDSGFCVKPLSSISAALTGARRGGRRAEHTAINCLLSRVAVATRLKPEAQMKPVFMPSVPG